MSNIEQIPDNNTPEITDGFEGDNTGNIDITPDNVPVTHDDISDDINVKNDSIREQVTQEVVDEEKCY
eukprot:5545063-Amphidinium_carterae.1